MARQKSLQIGFIVLLVLLIATFGYRFFSNRPQNISEEHWKGDWKISYFYEHEPDLIYHGALQFSQDYTQTGKIEVTPPRSNKLTTLELENVEVVRNGTSITGELVHTQYKIQGGYLRENFEWGLMNTDKFQGVGQCLAFCAEGTEEKKIIWTGIRAQQ